MDRVSSAIFSCQGSREEPGDKLTRLACLGVAGGGERTDYFS